MEDEEDIFGSDNDAPAPLSKAVNNNNSNGNNNNDEDLFNDSDDESRPAAKKTQKQKRGKNIKKRSKTELEDSDDEHPAAPPTTKRRTKKGKQRAATSTSSDDETNNAKQQQQEQEQHSAGEEEGEEEDEYDQVEENVKPKKTSKSVQNRSTKPEKAIKTNDDPLSQMLQTLKKTKVVPLTDTEKEGIVENLCVQMENAAKRDDEDRANGKPAMHKLSMLHVVEQAVTMNSLLQTLLEHHNSKFLNILRCWIAPLDDQALPSLTLRTSAYKMLSMLPCKPEELKHSGIAKVVVRLHKHPLESANNKKLLQEIINKWSRIVFHKSTEKYEAGAAGVAMNADITSTLMKQYSNLASSSHAGPQESIIPVGDQNVRGESTLRARAPVSNGYMFTVALDNLGTQEHDVQSKHAMPTGSKREKLSKKLAEGSTSGKKTNLRAMDSSVSGKDIRL